MKIINKHLIAPLTLGLCLVLVYMLSPSNGKKGIEKKVAPDYSKTKFMQEIENPRHFKVKYFGKLSKLVNADPNDKGRIRLEDYDNDQDLDLFVIDNKGEIFVYENQGIKPQGLDPNTRIVYGK
jgi:hypothetical protein